MVAMTFTQSARAEIQSDTLDQSPNPAYGACTPQKPNFAGDNQTVATTDETYFKSSKPASQDLEATAGDIFQNGVNIVRGALLAILAQENIDKVNELADEAFKRLFAMADDIKERTKKS